MTGRSGYDVSARSGDRACPSPSGGSLVARNASARRVAAKGIDRSARAAVPGPGWARPGGAFSASVMRSTGDRLTARTAQAGSPARAVRPRHATAVPSSSTSWPGTASRVTPSMVLAGATPAATNRPASSP